jgi:hypothetical protein
MQACTLPEPESRNGLSLARNDAFATIARSKFPACAFDSTQETSANPFDPRLPRSDSVSRPIQGVIIAKNPFPAPLSRAPAAAPGLRSPSGL